MLDSIRAAIPSTWRERCDELRSLGDVGLGEYLESSGLELDDIYAGGHSWSEMRRDAGLTDRARRTCREGDCCARSARLLHVDDDERLEAYPLLLGGDQPPSA